MKIKELPHGPNLRVKWLKIQREPHARAWNEFEPFYGWAIAQGYGQGCGIKRDDEDKPWSPGNCRIVQAPPATRDDCSRAGQWDQATADFRRRLAWAATHNPAAIIRLLSNGVPAAKKAAPEAATSGSGTGGE